MSFRVLRHRFKSDKSDDKKDSKSVTGESEHDELVESFEDLTATSQESGASRLPVERSSYKLLDDNMDAVAGDSRSDSPLADDDRAIFEQQLTQLQEQLMSVMIENQSLQSEVNSLERVKCELSYERKRCEEIEKKLETVAKKKGSKVNRSNSDITRNKSASLPSGSRTRSPSPSSVADEEDGREEKEVEVKVHKPRSFVDHVWEKVLDVFYNFMEDFADLPPPPSDYDPEGDPLTVKKLKENIKRFGTEAKPYFSTCKGISELLSWKCAPYTLTVFLVYMYAVWQGVLLPLLFFCLTFRLFINFLRFRGWNVNFNFFDSSEEDKETEDKDLGVSDKFNLVLHVARKAQNILGGVADSLEKIKSLFLWRHPPASRQLFLAVFAAFVFSCFFPVSTLFFYAGLYTGIKLFIIDNIYRRYPRVQQKYDSVWRLWEELPTDLEYERNYVKSEIDKYILPHDRGETSCIEPGSEALSMDDRSFCDLFSLPDLECPLPGWRGGRRCTLINREKSLTSAFKNGKLYLTHSFLCFERTKTPSPKNIVIPLVDIARLEKAKPYAWMPGGGMAIEIAVVGSEKSYIFGAIINRDDTYESLLSSGCKLDLPWAATAVRGNNSTKTDLSE